MRGGGAERKEPTGGVNAQTTWDHPRLCVSGSSQEVSTAELVREGERVAEMTQNTGASIFPAVSRARAQQTLENSLDLVVLTLKWLAGSWS